MCVLDTQGAIKIMKCYSMNQHIITIFMMAIVFLFLINGCSITKTAVTNSTQLAAVNNYSNINVVENDSNFDLHIFTNDKEALIVPCYYWKMLDNNKK